MKYIYICRQYLELNFKNKNYPTFWSFLKYFLTIFEFEYSIKLTFDSILSDIRVRPLKARMICLCSQFWELVGRVLLKGRKKCLKSFLIKTQLNFFDSKEVSKVYYNRREKWKYFSLSLMIWKRLLFEFSKLIITYN